MRAPPVVGTHTQEAQMTRRIAALVFALTINPALVRAQDTVLTVTVPSAEVHKGPSTVTPVVGHVSRGTVLPVARNLGSWAKIAWPDTPDGVGYVHVTMGRLNSSKVDSPGAAQPPQAPTASAPQTTSTPAPAATVRSTPPTRTAVRDQTGASITHIFGVGGMVGSMRSLGATARVWRNDHLGIQFELTRDAMSSDVATGRVTSLQFAPGIVYGLFDRVSDYVWIRPYVGSALSVRRQTLKLPAPTSAETASDTGVGYRVFGGSELTFAGAMRFGLSAEVGYRRFPTPFAGFEADRFAVSLAGHWYIK
jgi:hypothetical protein